MKTFKFLIQDVTYFQMENENEIKSVEGLVTRMI